MSRSHGARRRAPLVVVALGLYSALAGAGMARAMRRAPLLPSSAATPA